MTSRAPQRISGARSARRPHWSLGRQAKRLADSGSLLDWSWATSESAGAWS
ncbi:hypothetical protein [Kitasatospora sp. NPDC091207]|uniref:hypothetical protein n=1 Tax=Kitasatospora sp. NPDC091207 TaxID=3364083 RepID=UPI0037FD63FC